jgi:hypothetical protein
MLAHRCQANSQPDSHKRPYTDKIILSTLPHFAACYFAKPVAYAIIIGISSTCSILWHRAGEPRANYLFYLDYGMAAAWTLAELAIAYSIGNPTLIFAVIALNAAVVISNRIEHPNIPYTTTHSIWHCFSWFKGIYIAYLLDNA